MITVNGDLHPVEFMVTLAHELAHFDVYRHYGRSRSIKPHGAEWKQVFRQYIAGMIEDSLGNEGSREFRESGEAGIAKVVTGDYLGDAVRRALERCYFGRERIASTPCGELKRALSDGRSGDLIRVEDLLEGQVFEIRNGRRFVKGPKLRTRYRCKEFGTKRIYTVHGLAEVTEILQ